MPNIDRTFMTWRRAGEHLNEADRLARAAADRRRTVSDRRGSRSLAWAALGAAADLTHAVALHPRLARRAELRLRLVDSIADRLAAGRASTAIQRITWLDRAAANTNGRRRGAGSPS